MKTGTWDEILILKTRAQFSTRGYDGAALLVWRYPGYGGNVCHLARLCKVDNSVPSGSEERLCGVNKNPSIKYIVSTIYHRQWAGSFITIYRWQLRQFIGTNEALSTTNPLSRTTYQPWPNGQIYNQGQKLFSIPQVHKSDVTKWTISMIFSHVTKILLL